jgi:Domain of unknown function (DUF5979)
MVKRVSRVLSVVGAGVLASSAVASVASAQVTNQKPINVTIKFVGPVPTGVTGATLAATCTAGASYSSASTFSSGTAGASGTLQFALTKGDGTAANPGSSCVFAAGVAGSGGNVALGGINISVGGVGGRFLADGTTLSGRPGTIIGQVSSTAVLPVFDTTDVVVTISYPQITVKKVVNGDEPTPGFAYPMTVSCVTPSSSDTFIDIAANGNIGKGLVAGGENGFVTVPYQVAASGPFLAVNAQAALYDSATGALITPATAATGGGYVAGDLVVPGGGYVAVPVYNASNVLVATVLVWDAKTTNVINAPDQLGSAANLAVAVTSNGVTKTLGAWVVDAIQKLPAKPLVTKSIKVFDFRTNVSKITAPDVLGNAANLNQSITTITASGAVTKTLAEWINILLSARAPGAISPASIKLKGGASTSLGLNELPNLTPNSLCVVTETDSQGAALAYSSTVTLADGTAGTPLSGETVNGVFSSKLTAMNETVTVTNSFYGDLVISKVVTGDPKTNIATYEISVACDKGGPKDTFLLKDRQSKFYANIAAGTNCLITETKSDGATASYKDNSGDNTTDGRVTIKRRPLGGCAANPIVTGAATVAIPGGPAPTFSFTECFANVIITNDYNPAPAPAAVPAPAAAPATAAPATAAPAVVAAPATPQVSTPSFTG